MKPAYPTVKYFSSCSTLNLTDTSKKSVIVILGSNYSTSEI